MPAADKEDNPGGMSADRQERGEAGVPRGRRAKAWTSECLPIKGHKPRERMQQMDTQVLWRLCFNHNLIRQEGPDMVSLRT